MSSYIEYVKDILSPFEPLIFKRMFGGYGIYKSQLMVALVTSNELYFKANTESAKYFRSMDSEPFTYERKGKTIALSYWKLPPEIAEDQILLKKWFDLALESAKNKI